MSSPVGRLTLISSEAGLHALVFDQERAGCESGFRQLAENPEHPTFLLACSQLEEYFGGERVAFDVPLALAGTAFQIAAWQRLREIPYGAVATYGEQARALGSVHLARAIGLANSKNPVSIIVPCHRVIGQGGALTGFGGGLDAKAQLLTFERSVLKRRGGRP